MKRLTIPLFLLVPLLVVLLPRPAVAAGKGAKPDTSKLPLPVARPVDFSKEVYPLLKETCFQCHGAGKQKGKYRIDTREGAFKITEDHGPAIKAGHSGESAIILMICGLIDEMLMPPPSDKPGQSGKLTDEQVGILRAWIDQGAVWPEGPIVEFVKPVTFETDVKPLFAQACGACHTGTSAKGSFAVDTAAAILKGGANYPRVVTPGDPRKSSLLSIIAGKDEDLPAAEKHKLTPKQIELVEKWIVQGAK